MRYFRTEDSNFTYEDVRSLLIEKDYHHTADPILRGSLNYEDFSRWVGNYIHSIQGFFFRHDSKLNTHFERD